jgi:hypothetical protein
MGRDIQFLVRAATSTQQEFGFCIVCLYPCGPPSPEDGLTKEGIETKA